MAPVRFTRKEIEQRNTEDDAVVIIDNVVCDLTRFLLDHPGGVEPLMEVAGKDASESFHEVGHSEYARDWMKTFAIGEVVEEDRWDVIPWPPSIIDTEPERPKPSPPGFLDVWGGPLMVITSAVLFCVWLFSVEEKGTQ